VVVVAVVNAVVVMDVVVDAEAVGCWLQGCRVADTQEFV
jgi:hypothetical protein